MSVFTFHLTETSWIKGFQALVLMRSVGKVQGLVHAEQMTGMTLGAPLISSKRILPNQIAVFAQWENQEAIDHFLKNHALGKILVKGWHCRLRYVRQWGSMDAFSIPDQAQAEVADTEPVVAVTLARMKLFHVPRFLHWGRPAEKIVRDHPGITLALAAIRFPRTVSTFSVWKTQEEMIKMVHGHSQVPKPKRHSDAMKERDRKDFHFHFTTLRFKPLAEYGSWQGRSQIIPDCPYRTLS